MPETITLPGVSPRLTYVGLWAVGTVLYVGLLVAGYVISAAVGFGLFAAAAVAYHHTREAPLFDERDRAVLQAAGANTISVFGIGSAIVFPTTAALWAAGVIRWPDWLTPIALFVGGFFLVWLAMVALARRER
ncbi:hypothetical protein [Halorarius litoreus]|uniref:hypothetical protein n=1 Tax=Halorarius litoreus TaxID=2962676 RepID=UPI0020CBBDCC|nr:hypothetical protein [Halorarius litoreus]